MRDLRIGFTTLGSYRDEKAIGMIRKLGDEPPLPLRELGTWGASA